MRAFAKVLESYTIADLIADTEGVATALGIDEAPPRSTATWSPAVATGRSKT